MALAPAFSNASAILDACELLSIPNLIFTVNGTSIPFAMPSTNRSNFAGFFNSAPAPKPRFHVS